MKFLTTALFTEQLRWLLLEVRKAKTAQLDLYNKARKDKSRGDKVVY